MSDYVYETLEHAGLVIEIVQDIDPAFDPLRDHDHAGTILSWGQLSSSANASIHEPDLETHCDHCEGCGELPIDRAPGDPVEDCPHCDNGWVTITWQQWFKRNYEAELAIPLDYDTRGPYATFETADDFDDANAVWIFTSKDLEEWGYKSFSGIGDLNWMRSENWLQGRLARQVVANAEAIDKTTKYVEAAVKEYSDWCQGNVWGIVVRERGQEIWDEPGEILDSCWGFIGDPDSDYIMSEAKAMAEAKNPAEVGR